MAPHLLIDTDPGIDDALAILLALCSPEVSVEAVTTEEGNVGVDRATDNLARILEVARPLVLPRLGRGAEAPLKRALITAGDVHGEDGLGNLDRFVEANGRLRYPLPSTPLEMRAGHIVVMGGAIATPGNVTPAAEFNFYVDPEAAAAVFEAGLPLELVPLDVTRQVVLSQHTLRERVGRGPGAVARFIADFTLHGFALGSERGDGGIVMHDPLAMGVALDPSLVGFEELRVEIECEGRVTRGLSLADRRPISGRLKRAPNCRVAMSVDAPRFLELFLERLCPASA